MYTLIPYLYIHHTAILHTCNYYNHICFLSAPFVVAFVQTTYTVLESEGPVEVCVNLTRPGFDILDEPVRVRVYRCAARYYYACERGQAR